MPDDITSRLRAMAGPIVPNVCTEAADAIERLRNERDEARREICRDEADLISMELGGAAIFAASIAKRRGWNCFKEAQ